MSQEPTYIQGKVALLYKAKERAVRLMSSAIDVFRQAELRDGEALQLLEMEEELDSLSDSDVDIDDDSGGSDEN